MLVSLGSSGSTYYMCRRLDDRELPQERRSDIQIDNRELPQGSQSNGRLADRLEGLERRIQMVEGRQDKFGSQLLNCYGHLEQVHRIFETERQNAAIEKKKAAYVKKSYEDLGKNK